jgi:hypothetical protein
MGKEDNDGNGESLTVDDAAERFEAMLPDEGEGDTADETSTSDADDTEQDAADDESEEETEEESDEQDAEADPDESEETEGEDDESDDDPEVVVRVDGSDVRVKLSEALAGYSRTQDYTRKTMALSEKAKAAEQKAAEVNTAREQYVEKLTLLEQALKSQAGPEPDWAKERQELTPSEFAALKADWDISQQAAQRVVAERQAEQNKVAEERSTQYQAYLASEMDKLHAVIPELKDPAKSEARLNELRDYGLKAGFSEQEIDSWADHRAFVVLDKALKYDKSQKVKDAAKKKLTPPGKVVRPGAAKKPKKAVPELQRAKARLAKTGRIEDAARAFMHLIDE